MSDVFLTAEQKLALERQRLDWQRHNLWMLLSNNGTNGWKYPCLCSKCNVTDVRE